MSVDKVTERRKKKKLRASAHSEEGPETEAW